MPNTNIIKNYYNNLLNSQVNMKVAADEYKAYLNAIKTLSDTFDNLLDDKNKKTLKKEDVENIRKAYKDIFTKGREFLAKAKTSKAGRDKTLNTRMALVMNAEKKIAESSMAFSGAVAAEGMTLPEIFDTIRGREIEVDENQLKNAGESMSVRIPIGFSTDSGRKVEGYFTEYTTRDFKRERDELINRVSGENSTLKNIFRTLFTDKILMRAVSGMPVDKENFIVEQLEKGEYDNMRMAHILGRAYSGFSENFSGEISNKVFRTINKICEKMPDLDKRVITFLREAGGIYNKHEVATDGVKMVGTKKIEDRNAAMTAVADLLGCPNIIARSTKMSIIVNGHRRDGIFMENAEGSDLSKIIDKDSPLAKVENRTDIKPEYYSQLSDLQILDFVCGNTDRHIRNMMYKTETEVVNGKQVTKVTGLMGIDNDSSFGILDGKSGSMKMPAVGKLKVINDKTAERVMMMTPELLSLALKPYHLDEKEISAAKKRLRLVQKAISKNEIKKVKEDEWKTLDIARKCVALKIVNGEAKPENYFFDHYNLHTHFKNELNYQKLDQKTLTDLEERTKNFSMYKLPERTKITAAKGRKMIEADMAEINNETFLQLQHELNAATAFNGTKEYQDITKLLTEVGRAANRTNKDSDILDWQLLKQKYNRLEKMVDKYLARKERESIELYKKGKSPSSTAESRVMAMNSLKTFLRNRDIAVTKYVDAQLDKAVNLNRVKKEVEQLRNKAADGVMTDVMLTKLAVKEHVLSEAAKGNTITFRKEFNAMVRLSKKDVFKNALDRINNPKDRYGLDDAIPSLDSEIIKIGASHNKKVSEVDVNIPNPV